jgi:hypothetical protein
MIEHPVVINGNDLVSRGFSSDEHGAYEYVRLSGTIDDVESVKVISQKSNEPITSAFLEFRRGGPQHSASVVVFNLGARDGTSSSVEAVIIPSERIFDACWNGNFEKVTASLQFLKPIGEGEETGAGFWPIPRDANGDVDLGTPVTERQLTAFKILMT